MKKVLFVSTHDSARSQMAAAYLNAMAQGRLQAQSVGYEPKGVSPHAIQAMAEDGIDISRNGSPMSSTSTGRVPPSAT